MNDTSLKKKTKSNKTGNMQIKIRKNAKKSGNKCLKKNRKNTWHNSDTLTQFSLVRKFWENLTQKRIPTLIEGRHYQFYYRACSSSTLYLSIDYICSILIRWYPVDYTHNMEKSLYSINVCIDQRFNKLSKIIWWPQMDINGRMLCTNK